jgi:hypothetical protein
MYRLFKDTVVYQFWQAFRTKNSWEPPDATATRLNAGPACFINALRTHPGDESDCFDDEVYLGHN